MDTRGQSSACRLPDPQAVTSDRRQPQRCRRLPKRYWYVVRNTSSLREAMQGHGNDARPGETEEDRRRRVTAERKARAPSRRNWVPRYCPACENPKTRYTTPTGLSNHAVRYHRSWYSAKQDLLIPIPADRLQAADPHRRWRRRINPATKDQRPLTVSVRRIEATASPVAARHSSTESATRLHRRSDRHRSRSPPERPLFRQRTPSPDADPSVESASDARARYDPRSAVSVSSAPSVAI